MKRVYCLYRVSTLGQVEKDDIPMQRQACHAFAEKQGWQIIAEFSEKGVSVSGTAGSVGCNQAGGNLEEV